MDNNSSNNNHCSNENFLYPEELKSSSNLQQQAKLVAAPQRQRSMSLLYCISKRLRRRIQSEQVCYNSQKDLHSSSTDSLSLSLDCGSEKHNHSCSTDLSSEGQSSRTSSNSSGDSGNSRTSSSGNSYRANREHRHSFSHSCYRRSVSEISDSDNDNEGPDEDNQFNDAAVKIAKTTSYKFSARTPLKGLHLNRISMSSMSRVLQHISSSSSSSSSSRSLSCNSTPLKLRKNEQQQKDKKVTVSSSKTESEKVAAKPQPQQQRILRQPINYVYLKGMSGLPTRRVPRSSLCSSFACR